VWEKIGPNFSDAVKNLSKGVDGHYYLVPIYNYPWVVLLQQERVRQQGYKVPTTWDEFTALAKQMQSDGLVPLAFAEKDGWPALGTFDILNLRINGFDYHTQLMQHKVPWTDKGVTAVFDHWRELMPYLQKGANGRIWQERREGAGEQAGRHDVPGLEPGRRELHGRAPGRSRLLPLPGDQRAVGPGLHGRPADGFMMPKKGKNKDAAKAVLEYIGTGEAESTYLKTDSGTSASPTA